jgi:tetratricopeptide (TPR) repeat protein
MTYTWLVEKYLEGELSGEALRKFELEILRNPEAARELERVRNLQRFMENQHAIMDEKGGLAEDFDDMDNVIPEQEIAEELEGLKVKKFRAGKIFREFRARISEVEAERELRSRQSKKVLVPRKHLWAAAASILLLLTTTSILLVNQLGTTDYQALYDRHYAAFPADINERALENGKASHYETAMVYYVNGDFAAFMKEFENIPEPYLNPTHYLFKGVGYMELGMHAEAIDVFTYLEPHPMQNHYRMWYTSLCHLALGNINEARKTFTAIVETEGHFTPQSKKILRKL